MKRDVIQHYVSFEAGDPCRAFFFFFFFFFFTHVKMESASVTAKERTCSAL